MNRELTEANLTIARAELAKGDTQMRQSTLNRMHRMYVAPHVESDLVRLWAATAMHSDLEPMIQHARANGWIFMTVPPGGKAPRSMSPFRRLSRMTKRRSGERK